MIIGIAGGSGSGKTTLANRLVEELSHLTPVILAMDNYYFPLERQAKDHKGKFNFDLPTAIDKENFIVDLMELKKGKTLLIDEYHFNNPNIAASQIRIIPGQLIIVEGLFVQTFDELKGHLDFVIFVDLDESQQLQRRIARDNQQRDYDKLEVEYQWENHVRPCFEKYLAPYKNIADFRFDNNLIFDQELKRLTSEINNLLNQ
ncbi:MAG: uridine kinase [Psychromonas sp.]|jgi:uridine kinase